MKDEVEPEEEENNKKPNHKKKKATNHQSVDDMEFDDPEYLQYQNQEDIKRKHKNELLKEREQEEEKKLDEDKSDEESEDQESDESDVESKQTEQSSEDSFSDDHWVSQFQQICQRFNKNSIDLKQFEKQIRALIQKLDPSKDEDNKKRLSLLTQHLVEFYQSLFVMKSSLSAINMNLVKLLTNLIYELTAKYGNKPTKQEPSLYIAMFRKILTDLNNDYLSLKITEKTYPQLNILFTFKLISILFPTSDFRHQITTPCLLIMTRYFTECSIQTVGQCFRGSFLAHLCFEVFKKLLKNFFCFQLFNFLISL